MGNRKIKYILSYIIARMPTSKLRVFFYRIAFGYRIDKSFIGWKTIIVVEEAELNECCIGANNRFTGPMHIVIKKGATIENWNEFICGWWAQEEKNRAANYDRYLEIGADVLITSRHYFDVAGSVVVGKASWIAGIGSQFWTHGAGVSNRNVYIGEHCYIGSAVRFAPGSAVGSNCIVGLGSVVTREFKNIYAVIAGQPAKVLRESYDWKVGSERSG